MKAMNRATRTAVLVAGAMMLAGAVACSRTPATPPGLTESGALQACPDSPNCVSSLATTEQHGIEALPLLGDPDSAMERLVAVVDQMPRTEVLAQDGDYAAFEFRTRIMRYGDDVEFLLDREKSVIEVRSASRVGHSDLGANRKRVEKIREVWAAANPAE